MLIRLLVCPFVCLSCLLHLDFGMFFHNYFIMTTTITAILYQVTYFYKLFLLQKKFQGQGQRSRSQWPHVQNHVNQFFSNSFNPIFTKLGENMALSGAHNRLDFGNNPINPSGSRSRKTVTLKMTLTNTSTDHGM